MEQNPLQKKHVAFAFCAVIKTPQFLLILLKGPKHLKTTDIDAYNE